MKREILCEKCGAHVAPVHPADVAMGFKRRIVALKIQKPANHGIETITIDDRGKRDRKFEALPSIFCDRCDKPLTDGDSAQAVTWWNTNREGEPGPWEENYRYVPF